MMHDKRGEEVRGALGRLVTKGTKAAWSPDLQPLLSLDAVRTRFSADESPDAPTALSDALRVAVARIGDQTYRDLLTAVLGLDPKTRDATVSERRTIAREVFARAGREISIGTIRQYHEPRALDELTSVLMSVEALPQTTAADHGAVPSVVRWHPLVHERIADERLMIWRCTFSRYSRDEILTQLAAAMREAGIYTWSADEVFGGVDLVLRAWVPARKRARDIIHEALKQTPVRSWDVFAVERSVVDSLWPLEPSARDLSDLAQLEATEIVQDPDHGELPFLAAKGLVSRPITSGDIRFLVFIEADSTFAASRSLPERCGQAVEESARRHRITCARLFEGLGIATFVIEGTAPTSEFESVNAFRTDIMEALQWWPARLSTYICGSSQPLIEEEKFPKLATDEARPSAEELLALGESATVEVKAGPSAEQGRGAWAQIVRTVAGMLNSSGGTLLLGAIEDDARYRRRSQHDLPKFESWRICGLDPDVARNRDEYEHRLLSSIAGGIEPNPLTNISVEVDQIADREVCLIRVSPDAGARYWVRDGKSARFFARQGARNVELVGVALDDYRRQRAQI
jgi:hypothetical protein